MVFMPVSVTKMWKAKMAHKACLESSGTIRNIFLPLLLLGRKIHFSRNEGEERCERGTDFYGFLN